VLRIIAASQIIGLTPAQLGTFAGPGLAAMIFSAEE